CSPALTHTHTHTHTHAHTHTHTRTRTHTHTHTNRLTHCHFTVGYRRAHLHSCSPSPTFASREQTRHRPALTSHTHTGQGHRRNCRVRISAGSVNSTMINAANGVQTRVLAYSTHHVTYAHTLSP